MNILLLQIFIGQLATYLEKIFICGFLLNTVETTDKHVMKASYSTILEIEIVAIMGSL